MFPKLFQKILISSSTAEKSIEYEFMNCLVGEGLLTAPCKHLINNITSSSLIDISKLMVQVALLLMLYSQLLLVVII